MSALNIISLLIVLAGAFGCINYFFLKLPSSIGILIVALLASLSVIGLDYLFPSMGIFSEVSNFVKNIGFSKTLMEGMLGLLLFAGALHVKLDDLREHAWTVALMATIGVAVSTLVAGFGFQWITGVPILVALVFGALISPTDPVAVMGALREANLRKSLEVQIAGESLFNDGVGYVVFLLLVGLAFPTDAQHAEGTMAVIMLFVQEAFGGALLGAFLGYMVFQLMKRIDDYPLEVLLSLGLVMGGYALAIQLHLSGPIMAVVAGLLIGDIGVKHGMSKITRQYLTGFWTLIDEILNAILFLLIGVEVFAIAFNVDAVIAGALSIPLVLFARLCAVIVPITILRPFKRFRTDVVPIMTWGGLKGGISVALALTLPDNEYKPLILTVTYIVVIFSIIVQGLTIAPLAKRFDREQDLL